jgi:hypothetical protein
MPVLDIGSFIAIPILLLGHVTVEDVYDLRQRRVDFAPVVLVKS